MGSTLGSLTGAKSSATTKQSSTNFAPFQRPAIDSVFSALLPELLNLPQEASDLASSGIGGFQNLLNGFARRPADDDLRGIFDVARDVSGLANQFNPAINMFDSIFKQAQGSNPGERAANFLLPFARGDFLDRGNPFADRIVQSALDDATARTAATFEGAGRLRSGIAPRATAREAGRISGDIRGRLFESERGRQLSGATSLGQLDINSAIQKFNAMLGAAQGSLAGRTAEQDARVRSLGLAAGIGGNLAGLQQFGLSQALPAASQFSQLPFVPLTNFSNIAFSPLGGTTTARTTGSSSNSPLSTALGLGLTAASFSGGKPGSTTAASTGVPGFGPFGPNLGPLAGARFPPPPV